jgi:hypothetical protein
MAVDLLAKSFALQSAARSKACVPESLFPVGYLQPSRVRTFGAIRPARAASSLLHLETTANLLKLLEGVLAAFSKCALKLLDNQADFDSAIRVLIRCDQNDPQGLEFATYRTPVDPGP